MLEAIFEVILYLVLEMVFELAGEVLSELGLKVFDPSRPETAWSRILGGLGYIILGAVLGALSYPVFPDHVIQYPLLRIANGLLSPIILGFMLCLVSWIITRRKQGEGIFRIDKFIFGVIFGAAYSITRSAIIG